MLIYLILITLILIQAVVFSLIPKSRNNNIFLLVSFIELVFISGLRKSVGGDTDVYINLFKSIAELNYKDTYAIGLDKGFLTFCYLLSRISSNPQVLIFVTSFIINGLVFLFILKNSKIAWLSVYLYITLLFFFNFMNLMRFALATAIILHSLKYIETASPLRFFIIVFAAASFHASVLLFSFIYFFRNIKVSVNKAVITISALVLSTFLVGGLVKIFINWFPRFIVYGSSFDKYQGNLANFIIAGIYLVILLFAFLYEKKLKEDERDDYSSSLINVLFWLLIIGVGFSFAAIKVFILTRYTIMFTMSVLIIIPNILADLKNKINVFLITNCLLVFTFLYTVIVLSYRADWFLVTPYRNVLFN